MRKFNLAAFATAALLVAACRDAGSPVRPDADVASSAPALARAASQDRPVYIVTFKAGDRDIPGLARQLAAQDGSTPTFIYTAAIRGFAAPMSAQAAQALLNNPNVASVELDQVVTADGTQTGATWGIDRIDQQNLPLSGTYTYDATGAGVTAYIIDTGIRQSHVEFGGRASGGFTAINDGNGTTDCNGHGTHVSGTVGGSTYGVAKNVALVAVRVLGCNGSGTTSGVIAGVDWVTANAHLPAVANMSLGGGASSSLDNAVTNAVNAGVTFVVAAGNSNANACNYSPARAAAAVTVGATTSTDARASYSNYGTCLDVFAPGSSITSAWSTSNTATNTISGTSMASPHVAGVAALYLQGNSGASPAAVTNAITANATANKVTSAGSGSPNRLLYMGFINGGGGPPQNQSPTASFSVSCTNLTCAFNGGASNDPDGSIQNYSWNFGDGTSGTGMTTSHTYASAGTYTAVLTVTDNQGATGQASQFANATNPPSGAIVLSVNTRRKGRNTLADLSWTGAVGSVRVTRNGSLIATTTGNSYTDNLGRGSGNASYQVCDVSRCSNTVLVTY